MWIIIGYLFFCFLITFASKKHPKTSAALIFLVGVFISGYRSPSYTPDSQAYAGYFTLNAQKTLEESWQAVISREGKDPFYYFIGNCLSKIGFTYREWFIFISIIFMAGFCYLMYKHSKNYFLSSLFMVALSYYYFTMTGLRQAMAMGICFFAFEFAYRKKPIPFILLVLVASLFHSSALIFLIIYLIKELVIGIKQWIIVFASVVMAFLFPGAINSVVKLLAWSDELSNYAETTTGLSIFGFVIQLSIIVFCLYCITKEHYNDTHYRVFFNTMFVGLILQSFAINIDNIFRMSMYFSIYGAFVLPDAIELQDEKVKRILYIMISTVLLIYMLRAGNYSHLILFGD